MLSSADVGISRKARPKDGVRCQRCIEHDEAWKQDLTGNRHGRSACEKVFDASSWRSSLLSKHRSLGRDLVCPDCAQRGFAVGKYTDCQCKNCLRHFGSLMFNRMILYNSKGTRESRLVCKACKTKIRCCSCATSFDPSYWSINERRNHTSSRHRTKLVCRACRAGGLHPRDLKTYKCQTCACEFGARKFDMNQIHNYNSRKCKKLQ